MIRIIDSREGASYARGMIEAKVLKPTVLFQRLSGEWVERVCAVATPESYRRGHVLFRQGQQAQAIWVVQEGWVHLIRSSQGQEPSAGVLIFTITPREALCGLSAIEAGVYHVSAIAGTNCRVIRIPGAIFREALREQGEFAYQVLRLCTRRIQHIAEQYGVMAEPVAKRIVRAILRLRQQFGATLPVTHRELAQMSWTTTESAIRMVRRLKQQGDVAGARGQLTIRNPNALEHFLTEVNGHWKV